ncbi:MAG: hypothetical protein Q9228_004900, partial [Teloschistes exilis]
MAPQKTDEAMAHTMQHSPEYYLQIEDNLNVLELTRRVYRRGIENMLSLFTQKNPLATLRGISINILYAFFDWLLRERKNSL